MCIYHFLFSIPLQEIAAEIHDINKSHESRKIMVGKVDGSIEKSLTSRFSIKGFPAFFLVEGWKVREYKGSRSKEAIIEFVTKTYKDVEVSQTLFRCWLLAEYECDESSLTKMT